MMNNNHVIFLSSTFKDMHAERDMIHNSVLPELTALFEHTAVQFDFVDLRWGIDTEDEQGEQQATEKILQVCFDEIERSNPFFVCFLGERYGWIPKTENIYSACLNAGLSPEQFAGKSITEMEIAYALTQFQQYENCYFFLREGLSEQDMAEAEDRAVYFCQDPAEKEKVILLKEKLKEKYPDRVFSYNCHWDSQARKVDGLASLETLLIDRIKHTAGAGVADDDTDFGNRYVKEMLIQDRYFSATAAATIDRTRYTASMVAFLKGEMPGGEMALVAPSGLGKSSLMAYTAQQLEKAGVYVLKISAGLTADSLDFEFAVRYLYSRLCMDFGHSYEDGDYTAIKQNFYKLLSRLSEERKIAILIDALNQFNDSESVRKLDWINELFIPENVRILYSALPEAFDEVFQKRDVNLIALEQLEKDEITGIAQAVAHKFHKQLSGAVVSALYEKKDEAGQPACRSPLYLSMLVEYISDFDIDDYARITELEKTMGGAQAISQYIHGKILVAPSTIAGLFETMSQKCAKYIGQDKNTYITSVLAQSRFGLRESDICAVSAALGLHVSPADFSIYRKMFRLHLVHRSDGRWDFSHSALRTTVSVDEAKNDQRNQIRQQTARYLLALDPADALRRSELIYYLAGSGMYDQIKQLFAPMSNRVTETEVKALKELLCAADGWCHAQQLFACEEDPRLAQAWVNACGQLIGITDALSILDAKKPQQLLFLQMLDFLLQQPVEQQMLTAVINAYYIYGAILYKNADKAADKYFDLAIGLANKKCPGLLVQLYQRIFQLYQKDGSIKKALDTAKQFVKSVRRWRESFPATEADAYIAQAYFCKAKALAAMPLVKKKTVRKWYGKALQMAPEGSPIQADIKYEMALLPGAAEAPAEVLQHDNLEKKVRSCLLEGDRLAKKQPQEAIGVYQQALQQVQLALLHQEDPALLEHYQKITQRLSYASKQIGEEDQAESYLDISQKLCKKLCYITADPSWNDLRIQLLSDSVQMLGQDDDLQRQRQECIDYAESVASAGVKNLRAMFNTTAERIIVILLALLFGFVLVAQPLLYMLFEGEFDVAEAYRQADVLGNFADVMQFCSGIILALAVWQLQCNLSYSNRNTLKYLYGKRNFIRYLVMYIGVLVFSVCYEMVLCGLFTMRMTEENIRLLFTNGYYYVLNATLVFLIVWMITDAVRFGYALWEDKNHSSPACSAIRRALYFKHYCRVAAKRIGIMALVPLPLFIGVISGGEFESLTYSGTELDFFWKYHWFPVAVETLFCGVCLWKLKNKYKPVIFHSPDAKQDSSLYRFYGKTKRQGLLTVSALALCGAVLICVGFGKLGGRDYSNYLYENEFYYELRADGAAVRGYAGQASVVEIPENLGGVPVKYIGSNAFGDDAHTVTQVQLPAHVVQIESGAFEYCTALETIHFNRELTQIDRNAFRGCSSLTEIILPESVRLLGENAFSGCSAVQRVELSAGLSELPVNAFLNCGALKAVALPEGLCIVGESAFEGCSALEEISFSSSVTAINAGAFTGCSRLESITLPDALTHIGGAAFAECGSLKTVHIPNGVSFIGGSAFRDCTTLESIALPEMLQSVERSTFSGCSSLRQIRIPDGVTQIDQDAFEDCAALEQVTIGKNLAQISNTSFQGCNNLKTLIIYATSLEHTTTFQGLPLEQVVLADGVESIPSGFFGGCTALKRVDIPQSMKAFGGDAFDECSGLEVVNITSLESWCGIEFAENEVDWDTTKSANPLRYAKSLCLNGQHLSQLVIPENIQFVAAYAFAGYEALESVVISEGVEQIGAYAFAGCDHLTAATIASSVKTVGNGAFDNGKQFQSVYISDLAAWSQIDFADRIANPATYYIHDHDAGYTIYYRDLYVNGELFDGVIDLPSTVSRIGSYVFEGFEEIKEVHIPGSVKHIGEGCTYTQELYVEDLRAWCKIDFKGSIDPAAVYIGQEQMTELVIPNEITEIPAYAFMGWNPTAIRLHNKITAVGENAFSCEMGYSVSIPDVRAFCEIEFENKHSNPCSYAQQLYIGNVKAEELVIPEDITLLKPFSFSGFRCVQRIIVSQELVENFPDAFKDCSAELIYR